jgi:hypothetical protein
MQDRWKTELPVAIRPFLLVPLELEDSVSSTTSAERFCLDLHTEKLFHMHPGGFNFILPFGISMVFKRRIIAAISENELFFEHMHLKFSKCYYNLNIFFIKINIHEKNFMRSIVHFANSECICLKNRTFSKFLQR